MALLRSFRCCGKLTQAPAAIPGMVPQRCGQWAQVVLTSIFFDNFLGLFPFIKQVPGPRLIFSPSLLYNRWNFVAAWSCHAMPFAPLNMLPAACGQLRHSNNEGFFCECGFHSGSCCADISCQTMNNIHARRWHAGCCRRMAATPSAIIWATPSCPYTASTPLATPLQAIVHGLVIC